MTGAASRCQQWYWFQGQDQEDTDNFANSLNYIIIFLPSVWDSLSWNHSTEDVSLMFYYQNLNVCCNSSTFPTLCIIQRTLFSKCKVFDLCEFIFGNRMFEYHLFMLGTFKCLHHQNWAWKNLFFIYIYLYAHVLSWQRTTDQCHRPQNKCRTNVPDLFFLVPAEFSLLDRDYK